MSLTSACPAQCLLSTPHRVAVQRLDARQLEELDSQISRFHRHDHIELVWPLVGEGKVCCDFEWYSVSPGTAVLLLPGQLYTWRMESISDVFLASLRLEHFSAPDLHALGVGRFRPQPDPRVSLSREVARVLRSMANRALHHATRGPSDTTLLPAYVRTMMLEVGGAMSTSDPPETSAAIRLVAEFERLIDETVAEALKIQDYARQLGISAGHLSDTVREATGQRPVDLVNARRALEARRLLIHTPLPIAEVGFALGYASASQFGRWFRKQVGSSPGQFRAGFATS